MVRRFVVDDPSQIIDRVWQMAEEVQKRARTRKLSRKDVEEAVSKIQGRGGTVEIHGGAVCKSYGYVAETTKLQITWYKWRRKYHILAEAKRGIAEHVPHGYLPRLTHNNDLTYAYSKVFPTRYERFMHLRAERTLQTLGLTASAYVIRIWDIWPKSRIALVGAIHKNRCVDYLVTPIGTYEAYVSRYSKTTQTIKSQLKKHYNLNIRKNTPWDEILLNILAQGGTLKNAYTLRNLSRL